MQMELVQTLQILIMLFVTFFLVCNFVHSFRFNKTFLDQVVVRYCISTVILYFRKLYDVNYDCYHKFEIWRYYRFS